MRLLPVLLLTPALGACAVASTAVDVVTLPVKVVSKGVDLATTSQSEADEKRGREIRKEEERLGRERRELEERCRKGRARPEDVCPPR
nr:hypothetical protein [uncultured Sphingomonas sp.]